MTNTRCPRPAPSPKTEAQLLRRQAPQEPSRRPEGHWRPRSAPPIKGEPCSRPIRTKAKPGQGEKADKARHEPGETPNQNGGRLAADAAEGGAGKEGDGEREVVLEVAAAQSAGFLGEAVEPLEA